MFSQFDFSLKTKFLAVILNKMAKVIIEEVKEGLYQSLKRISEEFELAKRLLNKDKVFIKVNAIDFRKECYTSPVVISAIIDLLKELGSFDLYLIENSTQGNITRVVLRATGIEQILKEKKVKPIYLDEEKPVEIELGKEKLKIKFPRILYEELIERREKSFYLSLPRLKTHSMTTVTLSIKNQMGLIYHRDRQLKHNYELHQFLADLYEFIRPDFAIIDGLKAVYHGHYPLERRLEKYIAPLDILIAGDDPLAVDAVGAKILGYSLDEVKHLKLCAQKNLGRAELDEIQIIGDITKFKTRYSAEIIGDFPKGVKIIEGKERACIEGCKNNTLMVMEMLFVDYGGEGEFNLIYGKGFDQKELEELNSGPILLVGPCAIEELYDKLKRLYPKRKIICINSHNDLAGVTKALMKLMNIKIFQIVPFRADLILALLRAKLNRSTALTPL